MSVSKRILEEKMFSRKGKAATNGKMYAKMQGVDAVIAGLQNVAPTDKQKFEILSQLAVPLIDKIRSLLPFKTGRLYRSIQMFRSKRDTYGKIWIGPRYLSGQHSDSNEAGNHAHLVEYGTQERVMKEGLIYGDTARSTYQKFKGPWYFKPYAGKSTGLVSGIHFMQVAFDSMKEYLFQKGSAMLAEAVALNAKKEGFQVK